VDGAYKFLHDRVHEAAYGLIPESERAAAHLRIGRALATGTMSDALEDAIFDIVNHLNRGAALIEAQDEREQVIGLNLIAGKRARTSTAYASARNYLVQATARTNRATPTASSRLPWYRLWAISAPRGNSLKCRCG